MKTRYWLLNTKDFKTCGFGKTYHNVVYGGVCFEVSKSTYYKKRKLRAELVAITW